MYKGVSEGKGIRILLYHSVGKIDPRDNLGIRVDKDKFCSQMKILKEENHGVISLKEAADSIKKKSIPKDSVVITFDDGYKDNITYAAPVMEKMGLRATFFINVSYIGGVKTNPERAWQRWECMEWADLGELTKRGHTIGSHSYHHISLAKFNKETQEKELKSSKDMLGLSLNKGIEFLSYPYGHFDENVMEAAKKAGYLAACTTEDGINDEASDLFTLRRTEITAKDDEESFRYKLQA